MGQAVYRVQSSHEGLSDAWRDGASEAHHDFLVDHADAFQSELADPNIQSLVIIMPVIDETHDDWRRAIARDLARKYAPKRVNIIGIKPTSQLDEILAYLENAPGVTGQYLCAHE